MTGYTIVQQPPLPRCPRPIVIVGAGGIVRDAHLPAYRKAGFAVAGIFDVDCARAERLGAESGIPKVFRSLEDAVTGAPANSVFDVAVPPAAILDVLPALPDGAAVLIQKPLGRDLHEAHAVRDLCRRKRLDAAVNFQLRYAPGVLAARSLIEQGALGELHHLEVRVCVHTPWHLWKFLEEVPRVEVLVHSIHYIDLVRAFLGEPRGVYAKTLKSPKRPKLASTRSNIILDYGDKVWAAISANHDHEYGPRHQDSFIKWEGTRGAIKLRLGVLLNYPVGEPDLFEYCVMEEGGGADWIPVPLEGTWFPDAFVGTMASVMRYVEGSAHCLPTGVDDAFHTMAAVEAAYVSSESGATAVPGE